jgi:RNA:NAD 2'-phosphotransferase (TPT1/KptA family)
LNRATSLILYYRSGCSLCEEMRLELLATRPHYRFQLQEVDVDSAKALVAQYGHKVPVLTSEGGEEICHYFLDPAALAECFSGG